MLDGNCIFCKIIKGEIPSAKVYEDEKMCVFKDLEPKAKVHLLAVPKTHFKLLEEAGEEGGECLAHMLKKIPEIAENNGCGNGYRLIINQGGDAGQTVFHLHVHVLGGEKLSDF
ncbi:MAG: histidine triad nucleotide-binding protein [Roseburia sp.]|nr:histidine triad nucleotide-binding protein [Roseburia sp.]